MKWPLSNFKVNLRDLKSSTLDHYHRCSVLYSYSGSKRPIAIKTRGQLINRENAKKGVAARSIETRRNLQMLRCVIPIQQQSVTNHHNLFRFRRLIRYAVK